MAEAHRLSARLPEFERLALADQIRRSAVSVPANIAEGNARAHRREYLNFLSIARGSLMELSTHLEAARRVGYLSNEDVAPATRLLDRVSRLLTALIASLAV